MDTKVAKVLRGYTSLNDSQKGEFDEAVERLKQGSSVSKRAAARRNDGASFPTI